MQCSLDRSKGGCREAELTSPDGDLMMLVDEADISLPLQPHQRRGNNDPGHDSDGTPVYSGAEARADKQ